MRIVHVRSSAELYGAEAVIASLAVAQRDAGQRPIVVSLHANREARDPLVDALRQQEVEAESLPVNGRLDVRLTKRLAARLSDLQADVVHLHGYKEDLYGLPAARAAGRPAVVTNHLWNGSDWRVRLYEWLDAKILSRMAHHIVAVSSPIRDEMIRAGIPAHRITVIHNAVPQRFLEPTPAASERIRASDHPLVLATCARLAPEKGHRFMLEACRVLVASGTADVRWRVVGDGPLRGWLEAAVREAGLSDRVAIEGYCSDVRALLAEVDVVVQPSLNEGLPIALLEAMAFGLPVIATTVGAVPELIQHGITGLLVPPADPKALAEAVLHMRDSAARASIGGAAGRHVRQHHSPSAMATRYAEIYGAALRHYSSRH